MTPPGAPAATSREVQQPPPPRGRGNGGRRRAVRILLFVAGLAVLGGLLAAVGWKSVAANLALIGGWFAGLVALYAFAQIAFALGWWVLTGPARGRVPFGELFAAYLGGDSINYFTSVGGEPIKAQLLKARLGFSRALATVTVHRHADVFAQWLFLTAGVGFALVWFPLPAVARIAALASLVTLGAMVIGMTWGLRRGAYQGGLKWLSRFRPLARHAARLAESAGRLDASIGEFYREKSNHFGAAVAWCFVGWCGGLVETYLVLRLLSPTHGWPTAVAIESLAMVLNNILLFIPGRVGSAEGVRVGVYALVGLGAAQGTAYALVRRGRELVWLVPGFIVLLRRHVLGAGHMELPDADLSGEDGAMTLPKAILFDFGGTLDADGVAWKERFRGLADYDGTDAEFDRAFYAADDALVGTIPRDLSFRDTVELLSRNLVRELGMSPDKRPSAGRDVPRTTSLAQGPGERRGARRSLPRGFASASSRTSTATSRRCCADTGVAPHVGVTVDSAVVGFEKPDPRIFQAALTALGVAPGEAVFVGDSPSRDMAGARGLGMPHVLVRCRRGRGLLSRRPRDRHRLGPPGDVPVSAITAGGVIAAGEGSRLKELGVAKPLVEVGGVPLIVHVLGNFEAAGIASAAVIFNEAEKDCVALVRERFDELVAKIVVKTTRSSLESFREILAAAPPGRLLVSTVDAFCPRKDFIRFVRRAEALPSDSTVLAVTGYVHDEKPLWVTTTRQGRVTVVGGASGDAVTAGIYVFPQKVRELGIPSSLGRLRDFLAWLCKSGEPMEAVDIPKVVDVDRAEDLAAAEELAAAGAGRGR